MRSRFPETRVRVNVTYDGTLLELSERGAVVQLRAAQTPARQTTVALIDMGETLHLAARVIESVPHLDRLAPYTAHRVTIEFLDVPRHTRAALRRLVDYNRVAAVATASRTITGSNGLIT